MREEKAELDEWKEKRNDARGQSWPLKGCSERRVSKGKGQPTTNWVKIYKNLPVTKK